jgi:hypothetical protein
MHLVSAFQHSFYLELAIIDLEQLGILKENILALPLDKKNPNPPSVKATNKDGTSYVDLVFIFSMVCMLLGAIYGFVWTWGPIIWGLIGMVAGALLGLLIEISLAGKKVFQKSIKVDVILIVDCKDSQAETVEKILWSHQALGVSKHSGINPDESIIS